MGLSSVAWRESLDEFVAPPGPRACAMMLDADATEETIDGLGFLD
jgi:hypothetical protein